MSRSPDYILKALDKETDQKAKVGAGWINEDGSISIALNEWIVLQQSPNLVLTLFTKGDKNV